jgi:hypothetical protein
MPPTPKGLARFLSNSSAAALVSQRSALAIALRSIPMYCTACGFWDTGLNPTPPGRGVEAASVGRLSA